MSYQIITKMAYNAKNTINEPLFGKALPKKESTPRTILNDAQLERFMEAIKQDRQWHDFFYLEITTGLRRGELCGLMWSDFDEKKGTLSIRRTLHGKRGGGYYVGDTKTGKGRRIIRLPADAQIMRCDSDSGKKLIKSMVLRTADRQGMC